MHSPVLLDHFEHPRNVGELDPADARVTTENPACGDIMLLTMRVADGKICDASFKTRGCVAAIACGSRLTEMIIGQSLERVRALHRNELVDSIGGLSNET